MPVEHDPIYEDALRVIEAEALEILQGQHERSEITAEDCEMLYHEWLLKYRGQPNSPDFKI